MLPRAFGRDPCHRENDRGVVVVHGVVTLIGQASNPVGSVGSPRKTELENPREAPDIVSDVVSVSRGVSVVATVDRESGRYIGRRARGSPGFLPLVLWRPGKPGGYPDLHPNRKVNRRLKSIQDPVDDGGHRLRLSVLRDLVRGRSSVVVGRSVGCGCLRAA